MKGILIDPLIVSVSRGICLCGKTNFNIGFFDIMHGKKIPDKCNSCGFSMPKVDWDKYEEDEYS